MRVVVSGWIWVVCEFVGLVEMVGEVWWLVLWFAWDADCSVVIVVAVRLPTLLGMIVLRGLTDWFAFDC